ncbi:MAG: MBL fold metallo-hydrolase, partial [Nitrospirota bacterium]
MRNSSLVSQLSCLSFTHLQTPNYELRTFLSSALVSYVKMSNGDSMRLEFLGGVRTVTGSCFYIELPELKAIIDCGMYQGEQSDIVNREPFRFNPSEIDYLFLTHAHIDHSGLVPKLVREGFRGKIVTTP